MSGQPDIALRLFDGRMNPPEPKDYDWRPGFEAVRAYYEAGEGAECPVCHRTSPDHGPSCSEAADLGPSYRITPADFQLGGRHYDKESH